MASFDWPSIVMENKSVHRVRVGYVDTDRAGVVHHSKYLAWLEAARIEYFRARGFDYRRFEETTEWVLPVVDVRMQYKAPAHFDDELLVHTSLMEASRAKLLFDGKIYRGETLLFTLEVKLVCANWVRKHAVLMPDEILSIFSTQSPTS